MATPREVSSVPRLMLWTSIGGDVNLGLPPAATPQTPAQSLPVLRVMGQLLSSYIIAEGPDGLYLIDQHAAHERILFEQIEDQRSRREMEIQMLLEPVAFEVSPRQGESLKAQYEKLAEFGFSIEPFGEGTFLVRAVPALLAGRDWPGMTRELLDSGGGEGWEERMVISMACHSAVRAGQVLTSDEMREMVRKLEQTALPHTCPHGRPTMIHLSLGQLAREFGRS
ncbi:DNA mismatch repair protein MutL [subsurface metagenome]